ncbi:MAG: hypothetical protein R6W70_01335 [bacterium]
MKKIIFLVTMCSLLTMPLFGEIGPKDVLEYLEKQGIEYEIMWDKITADKPDGLVIEQLDDIDKIKKDLTAEAERLVNSAGTKSRSTQTCYAYGNFENELLEIDPYFSTTADGYKYKVEQNDLNGGYETVLRAKDCPNGSGSQSVDSCTTSSSSPPHVFISPTIPCNRCDNNEEFRIRFSAKTYTVSWTYTYVPGIGYVYLPITIWGLWWNTVFADGDSPPFDGDNDLCDTNLVNFCDWI